MRRSPDSPPRRPARALLALLVGLAIGGNEASAQAPRLLRAGDLDTLPARPGERMAYGRDSLQFGELRLPGVTPGARVPVVVVIHGGCWFSPYASARNTAALADVLTRDGLATWNIEYRRYDHPGGGWPGTFRDVASAIDHLRVVAHRQPIDTTRVLLVGHSAGGHLALWTASRGRHPVDPALASEAPPLAVRGVVSVGGISDLREYFGRERQSCGNPAVESLLGGLPDSVPARVRAGSPIERLPLGVPIRDLAGETDRVAPLTARQAFVQAARRAGDDAELITVPGGHFEPMAPGTEGGQTLRQTIRTLLGLPRRTDPPPDR